MSFPNVPNLPGVPPLVRSGLTAIATVQGVIAGISNTLQFFRGIPPLPQWGIFDKSGNSVVDADSFLAFSNQNESNISDFPVQEGGFATYNKVILPFRVTVRISKSGTQNDRQALLRQLNTLYRSIDKFKIVTPEKSYLNMNMERYEVTRHDKDQAFFLTEVDLSFREIQTVTASFTNTTPAADTTNAQNPSARPPDNQGALNPGAPSVGAQSEANKVVAGGVP